MDVRLDKFLAKALLISRSEAKSKIKGGAVFINGACCRVPEQKIDPGKHGVQADGCPVIYEEFVYLMMNKPSGVLSATKDDRDKTALSLLPGEYQNKGIFPAGRLDRDTEGFLLLTNDGALGHAVTSPARHVDKRYFVRVNAPLDRPDRDAFLQGIVLEDGTGCLPASLEISEGDACAAVVTLREGRFHQIKRMFLSRGKQVLYLKRIEIAGVRLDPALEPGDFRELSKEEIAGLKAAAKVI